MLSPFARIAIVLGLLSAVGPFAIDMYLPAMPTIAADLHTTTALTQATLTVFFLGFGVCQIVYGPWSDVAGRRLPFAIGIGLFILGAIGCSFAPTIHWLIAFRALQGMGAAACAVIPRAIVRDLHTGPQATRLMALMILVFSVSPILAPLVGSALIVPFGWRAVFVAVTITALVGLGLIATVLPETRPPEQRVEASVSAILAGFGQLLTHARFLGLSATGGLGMSAFFIFLANSSFIYIDHFGLTPTQYSLCFSINAVGFIGASQLAAGLGVRYGQARVVMGAVASFAFFTFLLLAVSAAGVDSLPVLVALLVCAFTCLGLVIPTSVVMALEDHGPIAGMASALTGTMQMLLGGAAIVGSSLAFDGTVLRMVTSIAVCATGVLVICFATLASGRRVAEPAE